MKNNNFVFITNMYNDEFYSGVKHYKVEIEEKETKEKIGKIELLYYDGFFGAHPKDFLNENINTVCFSSLFDDYGFLKKSIILKNEILEMNEKFIFITNCIVSKRYRKSESFQRFFPEILELLSFDKKNIKFFLSILSQETKRNEDLLICEEKQEKIIQHCNSFGFHKVMGSETNKSNLMFTDEH